ncbi:hypothetical protein [Streptacidiphilus sp. PAMC 29251]
MIYESRLELARILLADQDPGVVAIAAQPLLLEWFDGTRITLRNVRTGAFSAVSFARLAAGVRMEPVGEPGVVTDAVALAALSNGQREEVKERAGHIREVLSGFRSGFAELAAPGEPRPLFAPELAVSERIAAKSGELGVSTRTLNRWIAAYHQAGVAGLVDLRLLKGRATRVDPRWDAAVREVQSRRRDQVQSSRRFRVRLRRGQGQGRAVCGDPQRHPPLAAAVDRPLLPPLQQLRQRL